MTKIELAIAELKKMPAAEQEHLAEAILDYASSSQRYVLTDEQVEEIRRRRAVTNPIALPEDEAERRIAKLLG